MTDNNTPVFTKTYLAINHNNSSMQEDHVIVDGCKIRYLEEGDSKDIIVLIHGLGGMAERWTPVIPLLSKGHHIIALDLIGHGMSDRPQIDYTPDVFKNIVLGFLEALSLQSVYLVGTSLGGEVVADCASTQNPRIKKVVMISPAGIMKKSTPALDAYAMAALYPNHESVKLAYQMMTGDNREISDRTIENFIASMTRPNTKMAFLSTLLGMKNSPSISEKLGLISVPALIVWGSEDKIIPIEYSKDFVSKIPDCRFVTMNGCGHIPYEERPEEFSKIVLDFLSK